jgi:outer membrane protein assembly factor BamB
MTWMPPIRHTPRHVGGKRACLLLALAVLSAAAAGCAVPFTPPSTSVAQPTPALYFVLDGNFIAARSTSDLRFSLVALDTKNGHVAWRHTLETSSPTDRTVARFQPVYRNGVVYVTYYYEDDSDPQNAVYHGVLDALEAATGTVRWRRELGTEIEGEPVVDGSAVYVSVLVQGTQGQQPPTQSGLLAALDVQTGAVRWQRALDDTPSMATSADGRVFVIVRHAIAGICCDSHLLALGAPDGGVRWDFTIPGGLLARGDDLENGRSNAPIVIGGHIYVLESERSADGTANERLLALNVADGSLAWQHPVEGITATPTFNQSGDTLCVSTAENVQDASTILGLASTSGATRWSIPAMSGIASGCAASGDTFYLTQRSPDKVTGSVFAVRSQDGRQLWKTSTASPVVADGLIAPAVGTGAVGVYLQGPAATHGPLMSTLAVLRASDGTLLWKHDYGGRPGQVLDIAGDLIFNSELPGGLPVVTAYALDTGAPRWTYALGHL